MITTFMQTIQNLLGADFYTPVESATGEIAIVYHLDYITGAILLITFMIGMFKIIENFQKAMFRRENK